MARLVKVGASIEETNWHEALKDLRTDDVLLLEPGFYDLPQGILFSDITIKGTGTLPEDTTILGCINVANDSRFVNLENLCLNTNDEANSLYIPPKANTYLTLRNCIIKGYGDDTAVIACNGKVTLELYSTIILNGSVSLFADADFRLEMNDSTIENVVKDVAALALEGRGTAIINNSQINGSIETYANSNIEINFNNSQANSLLVQGEVWLNMLNSELSFQDDTCLYITDRTWVNIVGCNFKGCVYLDSKPHVIIQNSQIDRLIGVNEVQLTIINSLILSHTDFQDKAKCSARQTTFNGGLEYQYFLALGDYAEFEGRDLIFNSNGAHLAVKDSAKLSASVIATSDEEITVERSYEAKFKLLGMKWITKENN